MPLHTILLAVAALLAVGVCAIPLARTKLANGFVYGLCTLLCGASVVLAGGYLLSGASQAVQEILPFGLPQLSAHFRLDALSAFFLLVVNIGGAAASFYGLGYGHHEDEPGRVLPFYPLFLAGMNIVVLAGDAFSFLLGWEFMSAASWFLVLSRHREKETAHAAFVYLTMACLSGMVLFLVFGLLAGPEGNYSFESMRAQQLSPLAANAVMVLALLGMGAKAGLVPLHAWLPLAHPAAPSHVSALMSGVMTKVAIYGLIRVLFDLAGAPAWWWGGVLLVLGGLTAVLGILYALMQRDIKRLLAFSTVENIGIIVLGLGLALAFKAQGSMALAVLALTAALFHVLNHMLYKSLLFCGAGAVLAATHSRDMERMGGLIHRMPVTAALFLAGAMSISALPPFNGFVSEWTIFQGIVAGMGLEHWLYKFATPIMGGFLVLAAALTAVTFVKAFGIVFQGRPRSAESEHAREVSAWMLLPMGVLAVLCVAAGLFPAAVLAVLKPVTGALLPTSEAPFGATSWLLLVPMKVEASSYSAFAIFIGVLLLAAFGTVLAHAITSRMRRSAPWDCGFPNAQPETQYTASSFAQPVRRVFGTAIFTARDSIDMPSPGDNRPAHFAVKMRDPIWEYLYAPVGRAVGYVAGKLSATQGLSIRSYMSVVFMTLVFILVLVMAIQ